MTSFVGVDLHRNNFTYCIRANGQEKQMGKCAINELQGFASMLGPDTAMAVEATGNTFMFCSSLKQHVGRLVMDGFDNLKSIKGIGSKGAAILLSTIGNIQDFRSAKQLAAYIGIVPRVSNSNDTVCHGRITKNGSKIARTALVQCALIAKRYSPFLNAFHESVKSRRGGAKANIALARKFLDIVYKTLKNNWSALVKDESIKRRDPKNFVQGGRFGSYWSKPRNTWSSTKLPSGTFDWKPASFKIDVPLGTTRIQLQLGLKDAAGTIHFRDIRIQTVK